MIVDITVNPLSMPYYSHGTLCTLTLCTFLCRCRSYNVLIENLDQSHLLIMYGRLVDSSVKFHMHMFSTYPSIHSVQYSKYSTDKQTRQSIGRQTEGVYQTNTNCFSTCCSNPIYKSITKTNKQSTYKLDIHVSILLAYDN